MFAAFRTDSSREIGTGHLMRCLTLADALERRRCHSLFICRDLPGHAASLVTERGHQLYLLPQPDDNTDAGGPPHAKWLGTTSAQDALESREVLARDLIDWLVVDHYGLDAGWESAVRLQCQQMLVIDDLADRRHVADVLLDQNLGRRAEDYATLVPPECELRIGPAHALLRPEFARYRAGSLARRQSAPPRHILISMGGVDKDNVTSRVLEILAKAELPDDTHVTAVLGQAAPWADAVRERAAQMPIACDVRLNEPEMARLMADADIAIGACGTSSWERCCLGLPAIAFIIADNQRESAKALAQAGCAITAEVAALEQALPAGLKQLLQDDFRLAMQKAAAAVTDGKGAQRLAEQISSAFR